MALDAGLDPDIFERQINVESGFNPKIYNPVSGASGIAQVVPEYHPGVDVWNPWDSLQYAAGLMQSYLADYECDWTLSLVRYNGGGRAVAAWERGEPYEESKRYVKLILG